MNTKQVAFPYAHSHWCMTRVMDIMLVIYGNAIRPCCYITRGIVWCIKRSTSSELYCLIQISGAQVPQVGQFARHMYYITFAINIAMYKGYTTRTQSRWPFLFRHSNRCIITITSIVLAIYDDARHLCCPITNILGCVITILLSILLEMGYYRRINTVLNTQPLVLKLRTRVL